MNVDEQERKHKQADLDVEIIDLPDSDESEKGSLRPLPGFQSSIKPLLPARQRRVQFAIIASILAIVAIVLLATSLPVRNLAVRLITAYVPTPTAVLTPGADLFYISGEPGWGRAYLDGHMLNPLPRLGVDPPLRIARGDHTLEWRAEPFQVQRCVVSVPANFGIDTCNYNSSVALPSGRSAWVLTFHTSLQLLPISQQVALGRAVQATLDAQGSTTTIQPGEQYYGPGPRGLFITTQQPVRARLHFQLDTAPLSPLSAPCTINGQNNGQECAVWNQDCHEFCADPTANSSSQKEWDVLGVVLPEWDYTTLQGKSLVQNQPDGFAGAQGYELLMPLHILWNSITWQATISLSSANTLPFGNPFCSSAENEVSIDPTLNAAILQNLPVMWKYASGPVGAAGCVAVAIPNPSAGLTTPTPLPSSAYTVAYCLQRFGILLAANDVAHRLWPTMPMADAYEQHLAQQLVLSNGLTK